MPVVLGSYLSCDNHVSPDLRARIRVTTDLEMSFRYPSSWTYERDGDILVFKAGPGPDASIPTIFVQTRRTEAGWDLSREVSKILKQHKKTVQSEVIGEKWEEIQGSPVFRFEAAFNMNEAPYKMAQAILARSGHFFYLSCVAPATDFNEAKQAFKVVLNSLHFGRPGKNDEERPVSRKETGRQLLSTFLFVSYYSVLGLAAVALAVFLIRSSKPRITMDLETTEAGKGKYVVLTLTLENKGRRETAVRVSNGSQDRHAAFLEINMGVLDNIPDHAEIVDIEKALRGDAEIIISRQALAENNPVRLRPGESRCLSVTIPKLQGVLAVRARLRLATGEYKEMVKIV